MEDQSSNFSCSSCGVRFQVDDGHRERAGRNCLSRPSQLSDETRTEDGTTSRGNDDDDGEDGEEEEDALSSDLPLSSANVSGRVTPLSLASSTSRGGLLPANGLPPSAGASELRGNRAAGFLFPSGTVPMASNHVSGGTVLDVPPVLLQRHEYPDVTEKFGKFDLSTSRIHERELLWGAGLSNYS